MAWSSLMGAARPKPEEELARENEGPIDRAQACADEPTEPARRRYRARVS